MKILSIHRITKSGDPCTEFKTDHSELFTLRMFDDDKSIWVVSQSALHPNLIRRLDEKMYPSIRAILTANSFSGLK